MVDGVMEQCELPSFQPNSTAGDDLGLTLSPGSQSQLPELWLQDQNALDLGIDIGHDFDPFTDFGQLVPQLDGSSERELDELFEDEEIQCASSEPKTQLDGSNKRPLDELFENDGDDEGECSSSEPKKQKTGEQQLPPNVEKVLNISSTNLASIVSHAAPNTHSAASASSAIQQKFCLSQQDISYHAATQAMAHKPDPKYVSPYAFVEYRPSAPSLHSMRIPIEVSNETLQNRLENSRRRVYVLMAERNKYRDALLKYTSIDPRTGKLGIHVQEAELGTLRRVCKTQQQRAKNLKAEIDEWKGKYVKLAHTHNSLIRDYQQCTGASQANTSSEWEVKYNQLSHAYNDLLSTCAQLNPSIQIEPLIPTRNNPQLNPARDLLRPANKNPTPSNTSISYPSPPTSASSPIHLSSTIPPQLSPGLPEDPAALTSHPQPRLYEDIAPRAPTNSPIHHSTAGPVTMNNDTVFGFNQANGANVATARPIISTANSYRSLAVSPKEVEVIDLTTDDQGTEKVSTQEFSPAHNVHDSSLTTFYRDFRKKQLKWLHQTSDHDAVDNVFNSLNPYRKDQVYKNGLGVCYDFVQTQKHIRRNLGGPFNDLTDDRLISASAALEDHVAARAVLVHAAAAVKKNAARTAARSAARSAAKSTTKTTVKSITKITKITTKPTITSAIKAIKAAKASVQTSIETAVERTSKSPTPELADPAALAAIDSGYYHPTDDELGQMIEDEMLQVTMDEEEALLQD